MTEENRLKLNRLQHLLPRGSVVDAAWLEANGYSSNLRSYYLTKGWLISPSRGAYALPGTNIRWETAIFSLQSILDVPVLVGGRTSLELQGYGHYVRMGKKGVVHLYAEGNLPSWATKLNLDTELALHQTTRLFPTGELCAAFDYLKKRKATLPATGNSLTEYVWGASERALYISTPERSILELLDEIPKSESFHQADVIFQSLTTLRPKKLEQLLLACKSIKVKRLFLWFAHRHNHAWLKHLNEEAFDLGSGKRVIAKGGKLDKRYMITVPEESAYGDI
jgi:hypothetical protein